jgi:hypothetical protein
MQLSTSNSLVRQYFGKTRCTTPKVFHVTPVQETQPVVFEFEKFLIHNQSWQSIGFVTTQFTVETNLVKNDGWSYSVTQHGPWGANRWWSRYRRRVRQLTNPILSESKINDQFIMTVWNPSKQDVDNTFNHFEKELMNAVSCSLDNIDGMAHEIQAELQIHASKLKTMDVQVHNVLRAEMYMVHSMML